MHHGFEYRALAGTITLAVHDDDEPGPVVAYLLKETRQHLPRAFAAATMKVKAVIDRNQALSDTSLKFSLNARVEPGFAIPRFPLPIGIG